MTHLTQRANRVFLSAQTKAKELQTAFVDSEHLLHGLISDSEIYNLLVEMKVQPQLVEDELIKVYKRQNFTGTPQLSPRVKRILDDSLVTARKLGFEFISPEHILLALYNEGEGAGARVLAKLGLKKEELNKQIVGRKEGLSEEQKTAQKKKNVLQDFTIDLTARATQGLLDPVVERSNIIERVIHILSRRTKNNPALVGEAGVGKTAIVEGLAQKIVAKQVPEPLLTKRILQLDLMSLLAGASHRGEFEERMKDLIEAIQQAKGEIILFIDEIHNIVGAGASGEGSLDASNFLKPALARGELQLIGATTLTEYRKYIEKDPALERRFQPVVVQEPTVEQAIKMLKAIKDKYEAFHRVKIPDEVIEEAVKLSKRYVGDRFLPDKAVDLIDEAASAVRLPMISLPEEIKSIETRLSQLNQELSEAEKSSDRVKTRILRSKITEIKDELKEKKDEYDLKKSQTTSAVTVEIIREIVSRWTGIPVNKITVSEIERLANLEKIMHQRLINQDAAVVAVAQAVRRGRAGLKSQQRPIGSFIFLGPTGVGKTELAKTLADILFGQEEAMIRFDMTEYMEKHEVAKLLGAPPGYVGYEEGGKLTEAVRRRPYSVILFDEVEKAHPDIFNILLQILDDGRLTDNKGRVISFKNTVVICTSNLGTKFIQDELLKSGRGEVEEPPVLSTYAFSPRGREILTIGNKFFERGSKPNGQAKTWNEGTLLDYFSGQEIEGKFNFPIDGFDTHAISNQGVEVITKANLVLYRTATTAKVWKRTNLIEMFKDSVVTNALPDAPDEQLPTARLKTHAFTPTGEEIVSFKDRYWIREQSTNNWKTGLLKDYFNNQSIVSTDEKTTPCSLPTSYWDIHTFSPSGDELIIVGNLLYKKPAQSNQWTVESLQHYFGDRFPLDKEIREKQKIEEEFNSKRYEIVKNQVMEELRKFFRPELINRFDDVIIFEPLNFIQMMAVVHLQLKTLTKTLEEQNIGLSVLEPAVKEIVRAGFDPIYGARPLRRAIQRLIENPISTMIIEQKLKPGDQITVDFDGHQFSFKLDRLTNQTKEEHQQQFICLSCNREFVSEVVNNSTPICRNCGSTQLQLKLKEGRSDQLIKDKLTAEQSSSDLQTLPINNMTAVHTS